MKRKNSKTEKEVMRRGFTIAELLMVILIISLIAGVGGGLYVGTYKRMLAEKAARDIVLAAKYARIMAVEQQKPYKMQLDPINNGIQLTLDEISEETEEVEQVVVRDAFFKSVQFGGDVKFEDIKIIPAGSETLTDVEEQTAIVFSPHGTAQTAVIQVGDGKNHYTVQIHAATAKAKMDFGIAKEVKSITIDLEAER
jgi:prepilin-type N-terminal cleavage/methylation domain-containing protein